jgi:hypothetical protein
MRAQRSHWFAWSPTNGTLVASLTETAMIALYWIDWGRFYAVVFRPTSNLLTVWPLLWRVGSSMGTLMGGTWFTWGQVAIWSVILLVQLGFVGYTWRKRNRR